MGEEAVAAEDVHPSHGEDVGRNEKGQGQAGGNVEGLAQGLGAEVEGAGQGEQGCDQAGGKGDEQAFGDER